ASGTPLAETTPPLQTPTKTPVATATCPSPDTTPADEDEFGAELPSPDAIAQAAKCLPAGALAARMTRAATPPPRATIPASALPPVQRQGPPHDGGARGWGEVGPAASGMGSSAATLPTQQPLSDLSNSVSPGFLYPWVLNKEDKTCGMATAAPD